MTTQKPADHASNADSPGAPALSPEEAKKRATAAKLVSASFGEIITLMMRAPAYKNLALQDLEWMVAPAVIYGQFVVAEAQSKQTGAVMPVGTVCWAMVSEEIDKRLSSQPDKPIRLQPAEWRSGDIPWIIVTAGEGKVVGGMLRRLVANTFAEKTARMQARGDDGKPTVAFLELQARPETPAAAE